MATLRSVTFKCELITPMFLGGADQQPELRPASIRGAMRYWLRATLGGVIGDKNLATLRRLEAEVFGETERASVVTMRLSQPSFTSVKAPLLPHKSDPKKGGMTNAVPMGTLFDLTLSLRPRAEAQALEMAAWSALLWLTLGGIGRRSRRGAGSLRITDWSSEPANLFPQELSDCLTAATATPADKQALADRIADLLDTARSAFTAFAQTTSPRFSSGLPSFSVLLPDTRVVVWTPGVADLSNYNEVLKQLMDEMSRRKKHLKGDYADAFGGINPRRASPLLVTVHKLQSEWALVLTHLKAKIQSTDDGKPEKVEEFFDDLIKNRDAKLAYPRVAQGGSTP